MVESSTLRTRYRGSGETQLCDPVEAERKYSSLIYAAGNGASSRTMGHYRDLKEGRLLRQRQLGRQKFSLLSPLSLSAVGKTLLHP